MSKQYNIRWTQSDEEQLRKAVRNFNDKLKRLEKKMDPKDAKYLPERVSVAEMKDLINTRQDLKRELNSLHRFSKRGAEQLITVPGNNNNLQVTKWQKNEYQRRLGIINRKRKERREFIADLEMTHMGQKVGYRKGDFGMGKLEERELDPMVLFTRTMDLTGWKKKQKAIRLESQSSYWNQRDILMKKTYMDSIEANYGDDAKEILEVIDKMDFRTFRKVFEAEDATFEIASPEKMGSSFQEKYDEYLNKLEAAWLPNKPKNITRGKPVKAVKTIKPVKGK